MKNKFSIKNNRYLRIFIITFIVLIFILFLTFFNIGQENKQSEEGDKNNSEEIIKTSCDDQKQNELSKKVEDNFFNVTLNDNFKETYITPQNAGYFNGKIKLNKNLDYPVCEQNISFDVNSGLYNQATGEVEYNSPVDYNDNFTINIKKVLIDYDGDLSTEDDQKELDYEFDNNILTIKTPLYYKNTIFYEGNVILNPTNKFYVNFIGDGGSLYSNLILNLLVDTNLLNKSIQVREEIPKIDIYEMLEEPTIEVPQEVQIRNNKIEFPIKVINNSKIPIMVHSFNFGSLKNISAMYPINSMVDSQQFSEENPDLNVEIDGIYALNPGEHLNITVSDNASKYINDKDSSIDITFKYSIVDKVSKGEIESLTTSKKSVKIKK